MDISKKRGVRPKFDLYIGRKTRRRTEFTEDSKWANHFGTDLDAYEDHVMKDLWDDLDELEGKRLGCWCITTNEIEPRVCHGQGLMRLSALKQEINEKLKEWGIDEK